MKYSSYISFIWKNPIAQFFYNKTEKPILSIMAWCGKHAGITVLILLVIGMGLRIGYRGMVDRPDRDEITYMKMIEAFAITDHAPPQVLQPSLIYVGGALYHWGVNIESGLRIFNLTCSLLWLFMMYLLGRAIFNSSVAGIASLILAVFNPYTIRISGQIMREPLYLLIISVCLFCAVHIIRGNKIFFHSTLLGLLSILGIISRNEGIELLIIMPLAAVFYAFSIFNSVNRKQQYFKLICGFASYIVILMSLLSALYVIYPGYEKEFKDKLLHSYKNIAYTNDNF